MNTTGNTKIPHSSNKTSRTYQYVIFAICVFLFVSQAFARPSGISGYSGKTGSDCTVCHSNNSVMTVAISGPTTVPSGSTSTYTLTNNGGTPGGLDVAASAGTFTAGTGTQVMNGEITHSSALMTTPLSWTFKWTAPTVTAPTTVTIWGASIGDGYGGGTGTTKLTITVNPAATAPSITTQPANATVNAGQTATFSVAASGTAPLSYQWRKNGAAISGATSASYTTPATTSADNGAAFSVVVTNSAGSATSNNATLTVNIPATAPSITTQPANATVTAGQTASFSVVASGTAPMSYQWRKNGAAISGATSASYTTPATTSADNGAAFSVVVTNSAGSATSNNAILTVNAAPVAPSITTQPASATVTAGQTASFSVVASGTAPMSYQWRKNGAAISGATAASYTTPATTSADNGAAFSVVVTNSAGSATSNNAMLTVNAAAAAPSITTQPASQSVNAGQTASFSVAASGTAPMSYQWRKNGTAISGATSASYTTPATTSADSGAQFSVVVTNSAGSATSNNATLTVISTPPPPTAPSITTQPASKTVTAGQTATFSVVASGTAPMSYQWRKNGAAISGATSASYTTPATTSADNGAQFSVVVSNSAGSATSNNATLTVTSTPPPPTGGTLTVSTSRLVFYAEGGDRPSPKSIYVSSTGSALSFTAAHFGGSWLMVSPAGGTTPAKLSVSVYPGGLPAGTYSGTVKITSGTQSKSVAIVLIISRGDDDGEQRESSRLSLQPFTFDPKNDGSTMAGTASQGLVLAKSSAAPKIALAGAALAGAAGQEARELGFDVLAGSNCTATAPQVVVITADDVTHTAGCASGSKKALASGWQRVRFNPAAQLSPAIAPGTQIKAMALVMDQTSDKGIAVLNNIDLNGKLIVAR